MQKKDDLVHQSEHTVLNSLTFLKKLTMILISVSIATVIVIGAFLLGETNKQSHTNIPQRVYANGKYGFLVAMPEGWSYRTSEEKSPEAVLVVELRNSDNKIAIPIFIEEKSWELVNQEVRRNFLPETIEETVLAGQPALKIVPSKKEMNPSYNFKIKHAFRKDTVLSGSAVSFGRERVYAFHKAVEEILNSLQFTSNGHVN